MKKHTVAILGFGVVGGGVADLLTRNADCINSEIGEVYIKYILDLRDFPGSPFADRVVHDYSVIVSDSEVDTVIEVMGGSHPAYEYTVAALKAGKSVITSNKEVVAGFGDEFVSIAREMGVSYRFEAAVGGGIPVISPLVSCVRQNRVKEVRGILNGTTNYILTKMFTYGESFDSALKDAQAKGYAESNPAADVLGTDAARKITILTALATDTLPDVSKVQAEGITEIRERDVKIAEKIGRRIKLLGRCCVKESGVSVAVAPFMLPEKSPLATVDGVFNAVEVIADPLGSVMFYGPGAGGGATASAVVGDLLQVVRETGSPNLPKMIRAAKDSKNLAEEEVYSYYIAVSLDKKVEALALPFVDSVIDEEGELAILTKPMADVEATEALSALGDGLLSKIRLL